MNKFVALILTVLIFLVVGPAIGTLAAFVGTGYAEIMRNAQYGIGIIFQGLGFVLFFGYFFGWSLALIAGIFVAVSGIWFRWNGILAPIVAAVVVTLSAALLVRLVFQMETEPSNLIWFLPACLLATFICWLLTRGIVRRAWQSV